jgi:hypothetical protein
MSLDAFAANKAAQAAQIALRDAGANDENVPPTVQLRLVGAGQALLALAIGVNRLADVAEEFTGHPASSPGLGDLIGAIDRMTAQIPNISG